VSNDYLGHTSAVQCLMKHCQILNLLSDETYQSSACIALRILATGVVDI